MSPNKQFRRLLDLVVKKMLPIISRITYMIYVVIPEFAYSICIISQNNLLSFYKNCFNVFNEIQPGNKARALNSFTKIS